MDACTADAAEPRKHTSALRQRPPTSTVEGQCTSYFVLAGRKRPQRCVVQKRAIWQCDPPPPFRLRRQIDCPPRRATNGGAGGRGVAQADAPAPYGADLGRVVYPSGAGGENGDGFHARGYSIKHGRGKGGLVEGLRFREMSLIRAKWAAIPNCNERDPLP